MFWLLLLKTSNVLVILLKILTHLWKVCKKKKSCIPLFVTCEETLANRWDQPNVQSRLPLSSEWFLVFCHTSSTTAIHRANIDCTGLFACTFVFYLHVYLRCLTYVNMICPCDTSILQHWNLCLHLWCFASQGETLNNILIAIFSLIVPSINHHMAKSTCRVLYAK